MYGGVWKQSLAEFLVLNSSTGALSIDNSGILTADFTLTSNTSWTISSSESWLTANVTIGSGNSAITLTAEENTENIPRQAIVTLSGTGVSDKTIVVSQDGIGEWQEVNSGL
jgi:hypothetical protein